jgi:2,4'-dihydroxyacetophenone dioxygenase
LVIDQDQVRRYLWCMENVTNRPTENAMPMQPTSQPLDRIDSGIFDTARMEWIPLRAGISFKPITFFPGDAGLQLLLRVEPGIVIPRHRHTGEIHAFNLSGSRLLIDSDQVIGPGVYVHEPVGNVDTWMAIGDEPCVIHIEVNGRIEHLDDDDSITWVVDAASYRRQYLAWRASR